MANKYVMCIFTDAKDLEFFKKTNIVDNLTLRDLMDFGLVFFNKAKLDSKTHELRELYTKKLDDKLSVINGEEELFNIIVNSDYYLKNGYDNFLNNIFILLYDDINNKFTLYNEVFYPLFKKFERRLNIKEVDFESFEKSMDFLFKDIRKNLKKLTENKFNIIIDEKLFNFHFIKNKIIINKNKVIDTLSFKLFYESIIISNKLRPILYVIIGEHTFGYSFTDFFVLGSNAEIIKLNKK